MQKELTMDTNRANILALVLSVPIIIVLLVPFALLNIESFQLDALKSEFKFWASPLGVIIVLLVMSGGIIIHELIHGLTFAVFAKTGFKSIKFGIMKPFTPYCHCKERLQAWQYRTSTIMPAIMLGLIPSATAMLNGSIGLMLFGIFFTMAASGDFIIIYLLKSQPANCMVQDHPEKIGCFIYSE
jgi:uncharacterized integral membrane protein